MILLKKDILNAYESGEIHFSGDIEKLINPNSINVRLGKTLKTYEPFDIVQTNDGAIIKKLKNSKIVLDSRKNNKTYEIDIPEEGLILSPEMFYLGHTMEEAGSDKFVPMYEGRSSLARLGLISHFSAGFGDVGFKSQWTLEISVKLPLKIYPDMEIGQVYFIKGSSDENIELYNGKYANQKGVQESKLHLDK